MLLPVVHHHGFKCAGSTVVHLLNRNWRGNVLHIEHRIADRRIRCSEIVPHIVRGRHVAVTSHLLRMPAPGEAIAHVHFALVRDPIERLVSAFKFVPEERKRCGFDVFVEQNQHHACDFHVRHLARAGAGPDPGWRKDPAAVPLGEPHVLIGLVERFADAMFLLERRLQAVGCAFDGSTGARQNIGKGEAPDLPEATLQRLRELNADDYTLYARVGAAMDRELAAVDPDGKGRAEHARRAAARAGRKEPYLGVPPPKWTYLES